MGTFCGDLDGDHDVLPRDRAPMLVGLPQSGLPLPIVPGLEAGEPARSEPGTLAGCPASGPRAGVT